MKINKEYISMCEKAIEIQELWAPKIGDYLLRTHTIFGKEIDKDIWNNTSEINILHYKSSTDEWYSACNELGDQRLWKYNYDTEKEISVWLPRQDQLQEIIEMRFTLSEYPRFTLLGLLHESEATYKGDRSFEIAWLTLLMELNFNKIWNEEKEVWEEIS